MKTTIDISKASFASFGYVNQEGIIVEKEPMLCSAHGQTFFPNSQVAYPMLHDYPHETLFERAKRLDILDTWTPIVIFHFNSRQTVTYKGDKAESLWRAWNAKVFGKKKG